MAEISSTSYETIATLYHNAIAQVAGVADYYYDAAHEVLLIDEFNPELDLLKPFWQAYLSASSAYAGAPLSAVSAVRALQEHIVNRSSEGDINTWLTNKSLTSLPANFVSISLQAGFDLSTSQV